MLRVARILKAEAAVLEAPSNVDMKQLVDRAADATRKPEPTRDPVNSDALAAWFGSSVVKDGNGRPKVVYHGSTHTFDRFDTSINNIENYYGKGFYFTDDTVDVSENYATPNGPDVKNRIEHRAEEIVQQIENGDDNDDEFNNVDRKNAIALENLAYERARKEILGASQGLVYLTFLRIERPVYVKKSGGTYFDGSQYNEREDDYKPSRVQSKLLSAFQKACAQFGIRAADPLADDEFIEGLSAYKFEQNVRNDDAMYDGEGGAGPVIAKTYQLMGFDGIIMDADTQFTNMKMSKGTHHYIVWNPRQVKSALGNRGTYNRRSPRMVASR